MSEANQTIWRREDEFKDTEIGRIPKEWYASSIKEILTNKGYIRGPFGSALRRPEMKKQGIPVYEQQNAIYDNKDFRYFIDQDKHEKLQRFTVRENDLIISCSGTVGKVSIINENDPKGIISQALLLLRPNIDRIIPKYLQYFFISPRGYNSLVSRSGGTVQVNISKREIIENIPIPLPPLPEQKAIAHILSTLDEKIELNRKMNTTLEEIGKAIFKRWFVDFEFPNEEGKPYKLNGGEMVWNEELGKEIPKGWKVESLKSLFPKNKECVITGPFGSNLHASDYRDEGVPLILVKHVEYGRIIESDMPLVGHHKLEQLKKYRLKERDIIFTRVGAVGRSAFIHTKHAGWMISGQMLRVRIRNESKLNPRFLSQLYLEPSFIGMVNNHALGTTRPSLNTKLLENFEFLKPSINLQDEYENMINSLDIKWDNQNNEIKNLSIQRDLLLPKLISGRLNVNSAISGGVNL